MSTQVITLQEFADRLQQLADEWEGDDPAVLIGQTNGSVDVSAKDGYTQHSSVGYASEVFDGNGVFELGQEADRRFYGTMLLEREHLTEAAQEQIEPDGGDD